MAARAVERPSPSGGLARAAGKLPLRLVLVVPFLLQIFVAVGLTGWLSFRNGKAAVDDVASILRRELTNTSESTFVATSRQPT